MRDLLANSFFFYWLKNESTAPSIITLVGQLPGNLAGHFSFFDFSFVSPSL